MTSRDIYIGRQIVNYCIERRVASGSFGTVYLARHIHLKQRTVVIKMLHAVYLGSDEEKERFLHEAQILETLKGLSNILPLLDVGIDDYFPYIISEYAEQGSLSAYMRKRGCPLPLEEAFAIVSQVGEGLQEAHNKGVVHRDLKPENILFNVKGKVLLADFGLSTVLSTASVQQTHVAGTPAYMSPEQYRGQICKESDQYALACIAYELLTGHKPFDAPDFLSMGYCHANEEPTRPCQLNPQIPAHVEDALLKALSKKREERYPSVMEFVATLNTRDEQFVPRIEDTVTVSLEILPMMAVQPSDSSPSLPPPADQMPQAVSGQESEVLVPDSTKRPSDSSPSLPPPADQMPQTVSDQESPTLVPSMMRLYPTNNRFVVPPPQRKRPIGEIASLLLVPIAIIVLSAAFVPQLVNLVWPPSPIGKDGIGVTSVDGEDIGISDGRYAFDTDPIWVNKDAIALKKAASESLRMGKPDQAIAQWNQAYKKDTRDAESLIYAADQEVLKSRDPYISIVLGVVLGANVNDGFSRDALQGAYVRQKECNQKPQDCGGKKLRFLIARSGSTASNSQRVAQQIVQAAQSDKTIIAVLGWTSSQTTQYAIPPVVQAKLPLLSSHATTDDFTGMSPYFFRMSVPNALQAPMMAAYIKEKLQSQSIVIFEDPNETYSRTMTKDLAQNLQIKDTQKFTTTADAKSGKLANSLITVLNKDNPDLIFLATRDVNDIRTLLNAVPTTSQYANLKVFSSGAAYELAQSPTKPRGYDRLIFSVSAYPDQWSILAPGSQVPPFFGDYSGVYDPDHHNQGVYRYDRPGNVVMLGYDAISAIVEGSKIASKQPPTPEDIQKALLQVSFQGVSGKISFGSDGNPVHKLQIIIRVFSDPDGLHNHQVAHEGCFLVDSPCNQPEEIQYDY